MKRFYVVLNNEGNQRHLMKQWLRDHPEELPEDCDYPTSRKTSHQLTRCAQEERLDRPGNAV